MTWVIGACPMLGAYAITVSDIQVTFPDGSTFDLVRKAYGIGPNLIGGFAGSVYIGFELLESVTGLLRQTDIPRSAGWHPTWVAESWAPIARRVFERAPPNQQASGSEFIIVGPDPVEDIGIPSRAMPYLCRFSAPRFEPEITRGGNSAVSIGSGAHVPKYVDGIKHIMDPYSMENGGFLQLEVGNTGGWANGINFAISMMLDEHPVVGISQHVHTHVASREGFRIMISDRTVNLGTPEERQIRMPRVAQNWEALLKMVEGLDVDAATAVG
jgi:hypothetical protein